VPNITIKRDLQGELVITALAVTVRDGRVVSLHTGRRAWRPGPAMYRTAHATYTRAMAECLRCGATVADSSRFCSECGAPVDASPRSRQELRKTVTILFCDVVDSTAMGERSDPETVRHAMSRYFGEMRTIVERHGGVVERFHGDEVMAVFGVPTVHEDDALRAVRTGMAMQRRLAVLNKELQTTWGVTLTCRIGINTGEVVAGDPGTGETFVTGHAVNLAKRLEQAAEPGEILIGMATYPLVRDAVKVGRREQFTVKGKIEPVSPFRVHDVDATAAGVTRRLDAPLVDRQAELGLLQAAADASEREPPCQLFTVVGPAGIGKSRLVTELLDRLDGRFRPLRGRCLPYGEAITFWPVRGIVDEAGGEQALAALLGGVDDGTRIAELIRTAVGQAGGAAAAEETFWAIRRMLEELARERPLVVCFDDVHWASPTLLDLIEYLAGWMRDARVLILVLARSELLELRPAWAAPRANTTIIALEPLSDAESDLLLAHLADGVKLPAETRQRIVGTAEGNPLFVEQMAAMAAEAGGDADKLRMPPTIQALLAERLDRLSAPERMLLERASVIGKEFFHRAVMDLTPADERGDAAGHLFSLIRKDLVGPVRSDQREDVLAFRHDLIRAAAYDAVPKMVRAELHERFADWLKQHYAQQIGELEEIVGHHLEQTVRLRVELGRLDSATDELALRAGTHLASAGRRAFARGDVSAASKLLERAVSLLETRPETQAEVLLQLAAVAREQGDATRADALLTQAETLAGSAGDERLRMRVLIERSVLRLYLDPEIEARQVLEVAERATPVFEASGDQLGLSSAWVLVANAYWFRSRYDETMEEVLERARGYAQRAGDRRAMSWILGTMCRVALVGPLPVEQGIRRCLTIREQHRGEPALQPVVDSMLAVLEAMRGRFAHARERYRRSHLALDELGLNVQLAAFQMYAGWAELLAGHAGVAERQLRMGYEALERMGEQTYLSTTAAFLARAVLAQGRDGEAARLTQVCEDLTSDDDAVTQAMWRGTRARLLARRDDPAAERLARESVALSLESDCLNMQADALVDLAETLRLQQRHHESVGVLTEAIQRYEAKGNLASAHAVGLLVSAAPPVQFDRDIR
jgi:class 3 adenylate cyclase/tetratricopeptide (TPR) repeat protein